MRRTSLLALAGGLAAAWLGLAALTPAQNPTGGTTPPNNAARYEDFAKATQGAKELEGLFHVFLKDDTVYAEIQPFQFDKPFLCPVAVARGLGQGGHMRNFDEQWV